MFRTVTAEAISIEDHGKLAEALTYFPKTRLIAGVGELAWLCMRWRGFDVLHALMDMGDLEIILEETPFAAMPTEAGRGGTALVRLVSDDAADDQFIQTWMKNTVITKANRAAATKFIERTLRHDVASQVFAGNERDLLNEELVTAVARRQIAAITGELPTGTMRFEPDPVQDDLFHPRTDLIFPQGQAGTLYAKLGPESVVAALAEARREILRSADGRTDMWLLPHTMDALEAKLACLSRHSEDALEEVKIFETVVFQKRSIAEAITSGSRSPMELLNLLQHPDTRKWKQWLAKQPPDGQLIQNYDREVMGRSERFASLNGKLASFSVMQAVGLAVNALTGGLSLIPQVLIQTAAAGAAEAGKEQVARAKPAWCPSQWGRGAAADFLSSSEQHRPQASARKPLGPWEETVIGKWPAKSK